MTAFLNSAFALHLSTNATFCKRRAKKSKMKEYAPKNFYLFVLIFKEARRWLNHWWEKCDERFFPPPWQRKE